MVSDSDIALGGRVVSLLVNDAVRPLEVKRAFQSLGRLGAELRFLGFRLRGKEQYGPEGGYHLFYLKGNVLVRVKTRGGQSAGSSPFWVKRTGAPHVTVSILDGRSAGGRPDMSYVCHMRQNGAKSICTAGSSTRVPSALPVRRAEGSPMTGPIRRTSAFRIRR